MSLTNAPSKLIQQGQIKVDRKKKLRSKTIHFPGSETKTTILRRRWPKKWLIGVAMHTDLLKKETLRNLTLLRRRVMSRDNEGGHQRCSD